MKIERINDNQIKCTLSRSDLAARHIKISELAYGTEKTRGLLHDMMEQASNEVGFEASDLPLMIEAIPVSMDCIVLMITKVEDPEEVDTKFSAFANLSDSDDDDDTLDITSGDDIIFDALEKEISAKAKDFSVNKSSAINGNLDRLFSFDSMNTVIEFAHRISGIYDGTNSLYKSNDDNRYYLLLNKSTQSLKEFGLVCNSALEYGSKELSSYARNAYLDEHFELIIKDSAVQSLANV